MNDLTCDDCKRFEGSRYPYGHAICTVDGKLYHETHKCHVKGHEAKITAMGGKTPRKQEDAS